MLIIFDLDDTLIDTSGSITPYKFARALERLQNEGLCIQNFDESLKNLLFIDKNSSSSFETLKVFLQDEPANEKFYSIARDVLQEPLAEDLIVKPRPDMHEVLQDLKKRHTLCLVTAGNEKLQKQKIIKSGMDFSIFSIMSVSQEKDKKNSYLKILKELQFDSSQGVVCGDRINVDLKPAKELGFTTIHMRWGRGERENREDALVDFTVYELKEINNILQKLEKNDA